MKYEQITPEEFAERVIAGERTFRGIQLPEGTDLTALKNYEQLNESLRAEAEKTHKGLQIANSDLRGLVAPRLNLDGAYFLETNLSGADLSEVEPIRLSFKGVNLEGANFTYADLRNTFFTNTFSTDTILIKANLESANLERKSYEEISFAEVNFRWANLTGTTFTGEPGYVRGAANLSKADFREATMKGTKFTRADLTGANFKNSSLEDVDLTGANLQRSNLRSAKLIETDLSSANLERADLTEAKLQKSNLEDTNLKLATLIETDFEGTYNLSKAKNLGFAIFYRTKVSEADKEAIREARREAEESERMFA